MVKAYISNDNGTIHMGVTEVEAICGDYCSWCGECIVCAVEPVHATASRRAHEHHLSYTEKEAQQRGLTWT